MARVLNEFPHGGTRKLVMLGIANHDGDGGAWPSVATLARYACVTPRNVQAALGKLADDGWIVVHQRQGGTTRTPDHARPNLYEIRWARFVPPVAGDTPSPAPPVASDTGPPVASDTPPVSPATPHPLSPATPEPSLEPSGEPPLEPSVEVDALRPSTITQELWGKLPAVVRTSGHAEAAHELCGRLALQLAERGYRPGEVGQRWLVDMEAILRVDGRTPAQVVRVIDWLDEGKDNVAAFWRTNVRSPAKLRAEWTRMAEQYRELRDRRHRPREGTAAATVGRAVERAGIGTGAVTDAASALERWSGSTSLGRDAIVTTEVDRT